MRRAVPAVTVRRPPYVLGIRVRLVRVEAVIERPPPPPWIGGLPFPERQAYWPGTMLDWRWVDRQAGTCTALVQYRRDGLTYLHWVSGELLDVQPENDEATPVL